MLDRNAVRANLRFADLRRHSDQIPTLADWHLREFGHLAGASTLDQRIARLQGHLGDTPLPFTLVAWLGEELVGSAGLVANDMSDRPAWTPWLASVTVSPMHRGLGIGSALVEAVIARAQTLGFDRIYLYTESSATLYARLGWASIETRIYRDYPVTVMVRRADTERP